MNFTNLIQSLVPRRIRIFEVVLFLFILVSINSLGLLGLGMYSPVLAIILGMIEESVLLVTLNIKIELHDQRFDIWLLIILISSVFLRLPASPYLLGDQDPGLYTITAKQYSETGALQIVDTLREKLDINQQSIYDTYHFGNYAKIPGITILNEKSSQYQMRFYPLVPIWLSISSSILGESNIDYGITFFSLLSIIGFMLLAYELSSKNKFAAYIIGIFLAVNPLHIFFSKIPNTEIAALALTSLGLYYLVSYVKKRAQRTDVFMLFLSSMLINLFFYARMSGFMYIPIFFIFAVGVSLYTKNIFKRKTLLLFFFSILNLFMISCFFYFLFFRDHLFSSLFETYLTRNWGVLLFAVIGGLGALYTWITTRQNKHNTTSESVEYKIQTLFRLIKKNVFWIFTAILVLGIAGYGFLYFIPVTARSLNNISFLLFISFIVIINFTGLLIYHRGKVAGSITQIFANPENALQTASLVFLLITMLFSLYQLYKIGFTNSYSSIIYNNLEINLKKGFASLTHLPLFDIVLYISPVGFLIFIYQFKKQKFGNGLLSLLIFSTTVFWFFNCVFRKYSIYGYYYDRYLLSEAVPYALLAVSIVLGQLIHTNRGLRIPGFVLSFVIFIFFGYFSYFQIGRTEGSSDIFFEQISQSVKKNDLIFIKDPGSCGFEYTSILPTALKYYYGYNVIYSDNIDDLYQMDISRLSQQFDHIYILSHSNISSKANLELIKIIPYQINLFLNGEIHRYSYFPENSNENKGLLGGQLLPLTYSKRETTFNLYLLHPTPRRTIYKEVVNNIPFNISNYKFPSDKDYSKWDINPKYLWTINIDKDGWTNGQGIIGGLRQKVDSRYSFLVINTHSPISCNYSFQSRDFHILVNNTELTFSHQIFDNYYFLLPKNITTIDRVEIQSKVFPREEPSRDISIEQSSESKETSNVVRYYGPLVESISIEGAFHSE